MNSPARGKSLAGRLKRWYDNTPLPQGQATGMVLDFVLERLWPAALPGKRAFHRATGAVLVVTGCALNVWAWEERRRRTIGEFNLDRPEELVTTGPYAFSRHPMYFACWLIHLGSGVAGGTAWILVTLPAAIGAEHLGVLSEEAALTKAFGQAYIDYAARVPRYLPLGLITGNSQEAMP